MNWIPVVVIAAAGSLIPSIFLYAFVYEWATGRRFSAHGDRGHRTVQEMGPFEAALTLLSILSTTALCAGGILFFTGVRP